MRLISDVTLELTDIFLSLLLLFLLLEGRPPRRLRVLMVYVQEHARVLYHALGFVDVRGRILGLCRWLHQVGLDLVEAPLLMRFLWTRPAGGGI